MGFVPPALAPALAALTWPFEGLSPAIQVILGIAFAVVCGMLVWTTALLVLAIRWERACARAAGEPRPPPRDFFWVFLVPALNEERVIADSVTRLRGVDAPRKLIVVIEDGSDDGTAAVLRSVAGDDVEVLSRTAPDARVGKAAALNAAYRRLAATLQERGIARADVIVGVVDADGRLDPGAPAAIAQHFTDEHVGGVQTLVRIYNRSRLLTWLQDVEFSVYGFLYQAGRSGWGTAGMGGNGQFNRLTALDAVSDDSGPWRDRLTEDQDLGLRLLHAGFLGRQELGTGVHQQGLPRLRPLLRQRTRWAQGNLQAMSHLRDSVRARLPVAARLDLAIHLLVPVWQAIVGIGLVVALALWITGTTGFWLSGRWEQLLFFYVLGFGGVIMGCVARGYGRDGWGGALRGVLVAQIYAFYSWMLWPVIARAVTRQLMHRSGWAKTAREAIGPETSG